MDSRLGPIVVGRDRVVTFAGRPIGTVFPADERSNHRWGFEHVSGITLAGLYPERAWNQTVQIAWTKQDAAAELLGLHLAGQQLQGDPSTIPATPVDSTALRPRSRISRTRALAALMDLSRDFARAWANRTVEERLRARDAVTDVQYGIAPRRALQLSGFTQTPSRGT